MLFRLRPLTLSAFERCGQTRQAKIRPSCVDVLAPRASLLIEGDIRKDPIRDEDLSMMCSASRRACAEVASHLRKEKDWYVR